MAGKKDWLSVALRSHFTPGVADYHFQQTNQRTFVRVNGSLCQFMHFQLASGGGRQFCVNYSTISLALPLEHLAWLNGIGGRFPRGKSDSGWWKSDTEDRASQSILEVLLVLRDQVLPWFEETATLDGFIQVLTDRRATPHGQLDSHLLLCRAVCRITAGDAQRAKDDLHEARLEFTTDLAARPFTTFNSDLIATCDRLLSAIDAGTVMDLLASGQATSERNLGVRRQ